VKLSIENLKQGMTWWQKGKWPADYLNHEYSNIYQDRVGGLTEQWLMSTVDRLATWRAIRSPKPPNTKAAILASLGFKLLDLRKEYEQIVRLSMDEPSIETVAWHDIQPLYTIMADSKNRSPVFASKLGHFIFPKIFIVMDRLGTEVIPYDYYWQGMLNEWSRFVDKNLAIDLLKNEIKKRSSGEVHNDYPFETKIMELCHVGDKWK
jgi:hypothetical protein